MYKHYLFPILFLLPCSDPVFCQDSNNKPQTLYRPNIIYIYADDLGYGELGCYGQQKIKTPRLDQMAQEGIRFTQHYTSAPVCAPARCMLLTGKHGGHSYIRGNYELGGFPDSLEAGQMPLHEGAYTLAAMLKNAGYATALVGKWGLGMHDNTGSPLLHGFDYYYGYLDQKQAHNYYPSHLWENDMAVSLNNPFIQVHRPLDPSSASEADFQSFKGQDYAPTLMTEKALAFMQQHQAEPFFLYLPYTIPHASLQAPESAVQAYIGQFEEQPYFGDRGYASTRYPLSTYAAMITYLDTQVGLILDQVKALGIDEQTIVMFSSDNGTTFNGGVDASFFNSSNGLRGLKMDLYEGGIRMPFIARWPGKISAGSVSQHISVQYDLLATIAELNQLDPGATDGISFLPALLGKPQRQHEFLYFEYPENGGQVAIRMGDWKGVRRNVRKNPAAPWEIFNLRTDREEGNDVSALHPELVAKFNAIQQKEHRPSHIKDWEFLNPKFNLKKAD